MNPIDKLKKLRKKLNISYNFLHIQAPIHDSDSRTLMNSFYK